MTRPLFPQYPVLIIDDDPSALRVFDLTLRSEGINHTIKRQSGLATVELLAGQKVSVILLDITMPDAPGDVLLEQLTEDFPHIPIIIVTALREIDMAVKCMKNSAFDYMVKPIESSRLVSGVKRAIELTRLYDENQLLKHRSAGLQQESEKAFSDILTGDKEMKTIFRYAESIAQSPLPLLITGETGVGKELMARAVHKASRTEPFVSINVAGIDDNTFSDTLFGHIEGAFTGAGKHREGLIAKASGGTLFLDEIGDLKIESQIKLLRLIQENEYFMLGSDTPRTMDARIIAATNKDLEALMEKGLFRKDLFYRLGTHHIHLPALKERPGDMALLTDFFLMEAARVYRRPKPLYPRQLITLFLNYEFPGNVRELKSMLFDAVSTSPSKTLSLEPFKRSMRGGRFFDGTAPQVSSHAPENVYQNSSKLPTMAESQVLLIREAMQRTGNNKSMAAEMIGITRQRLARLLNTADK
ncbi:MAG: sigma-54 dependent transcriptional regulator [Desulfobacter sp.]